MPLAISIAIDVIAIFLAILIAAWKYAPYTYVAIAIYGANYTAKCDIFFHNQTITTIIFIIIAMLLVFLAEQNFSTQMAVYLTTAIFIDEIIVSIFYPLFENKIPFFALHKNICYPLFVIVLVVTCLLIHFYEYGNHKDPKNIYIAILFKIATIFIYGYGILLLDWLRYSKMNGDYPLTLPFFKLSEIIALPEKWILLGILIILLIADIFIPRIFKNFLYKKGKI